jgi:FkbM family methyltransferase
LVGQHSFALHFVMTQKTRPWRFMLRAVKQFGKDAIGAFGLDIRKKRVEQPEGIPRGSMTGALRQVSRLGLKPGTVIDVGAATHTAELYQEFKDSKILLIEPLVEFEPFLRKICAAYQAEYVLAAAGETPGTALLNVHPDKYSSSLLKEVEGPSVDGAPRQVPVVTIDGICAEKCLRGPYLIKVDVQGAELQVLAGAERTLRETEVVILEATLFGTMIGGQQLYDTVSYMKQRGFVVYDIYGFHYRPLDNALCQVDMLFVQQQGRFRETQVYATPEQRKALADYWGSQIVQQQKELR